MQIQGNVVLITGAASGIGKLMGKKVLEKGAAALVVWDINEAAVRATVEEFSSLGRVYGFRADISSPESIDEAYAATKKACGRVDILINCAGIITNNRPFAEQTDADIIRTIDINTKGAMFVSLRFLRDKLGAGSAAGAGAGTASGAGSAAGSDAGLAAPATGSPAPAASKPAPAAGHICNITSAAGMLAMPKMSIYAASKWAAIGWSESMRIELRRQKSPVHVTTVAPYFINTGMFNGIRSFFKVQNPDTVARKVVRSIERNCNFRGIPFPFHFIRLMQGLLPFRLFDPIFGDICGLYSVMDHYTGRR